MSAEKIRTLNDLYRTKGVGIGRTMVTAGIVDLGPAFQWAALLKVRTFTEFNHGNDPHREHDFGSFELYGHKVSFKFDYYARDLKYGSEDPSDPMQTCRVLTIMLASDY